MDSVRFVQPEAPPSRSETRAFSAEKEIAFETIKETQIKLQRQLDWLDVVVKNRKTASEEDGPFGSLLKCWDDERHVKLMKLRDMKVNMLYA